MSAAQGDRTDLDALQSDIEKTREELGQTVEALAAKLDVKARTRARVAQGKDRVAAQLKSARAHAGDLTARVRDTATDEQGSPRREVILAAVALGVSAAVVTVLLVRRSRGL